MPTGSYVSPQHLKRYLRRRRLGVTTIDREVDIMASTPLPKHDRTDFAKKFPLLASRSQIRCRWKRTAPVSGLGMIATIDERDPCIQSARTILPLYRCMGLIYDTLAHSYYLNSIVGGIRAVESRCMCLFSDRLCPIPMMYDVVRCIV